MRNVSLVAGILFLVLAMIVFVFADGLRRWYSGGFFLFLGLALLTRVLRARSSGEQPGNRR